VPTEDYSVYLKSPHWRRLKARYKRERPWVCLCGECLLLDLHHKTYERIGRERLDDLQPLCRGCHTTVHQLEREGQGSLDTAVLFFSGRADAYARTRTDGRHPSKNVGRDSAYEPKPPPPIPPAMTDYERDIIARVVATGSLRRS
jgi:hypothetical protein